MYDFEVAKTIIEPAIKIVSTIVEEAHKKEGESFSNSRFFKENKTASRIEIAIEQTN